MLIFLCQATDIPQIVQCMASATPDLRLPSQSKHCKSLMTNTHFPSHCGQEAGFACQDSIVQTVTHYNNNNNPICKAPECQKTSVAHFSTQWAQHRVTLLLYTVPLRVGQATTQSWCGSCYISRESQMTRNVLWSRASVCVCVSVRGCMPTLLHGPGCNLGELQGMSPSCAVLGGFAISALVALLWRNVSEYMLVLALCLVRYVFMDFEDVSFAI